MQPRGSDESSKHLPCCLWLRMIYDICQTALKLRTAAYSLLRSHSTTINSFHAFPSSDFSPRQVKCVLEVLVYVARVYAFRGEKKQAFECLEKAYAAHDVDLWWIKGDPLMQRLASDERYKAFLRKMNLPE